MNFASLCSASKQKLLNRSEAKNLNRKKRKKEKKKRKIDLNFASLCFALKRKLLKWSEAKISEKKRKKSLKAKRAHPTPALPPYSTPFVFKCSMTTYPHIFLLSYFLHVIYPLITFSIKFGLILDDTNLSQHSRFTYVVIEWKLN